MQLMLGQSALGQLRVAFLCWVHVTGPWSEVSPEQLVIKRDLRSPFSATTQCNYTTRRTVISIALSLPKT